jgi:hypothetical protein
MTMVLRAAAMALLQSSQFKLSRVVGRASTPAAGLQTRSVGLSAGVPFAAMRYTFAWAGRPSRGPPKTTGKIGRLNEMPCLRRQEERLDAYVGPRAGIGRDREGPLFRTASWKTKEPSDGPISCGCLAHDPAPCFRRQH